MWPISSHACLRLCTRVDVGYFPSECVCVLIEAISWQVCVVCVLSEECRAGSAPPGEDDVMADSFLFCEPVERTDSQLHGG